MSPQSSPDPCPARADFHVVVAATELTCHLLVCLATSKQYRDRQRHLDRLEYRRNTSKTQLMTEFVIDIPLVSISPWRYITGTFKCSRDIAEILVAKRLPERVASEETGVNDPVEITPLILHLTQNSCQAGQHSSQPIIPDSFSMRAFKESADSSYTRPSIDIK